HRATEERQRVHATGRGVDDLGIVMLPTRLVLLRPAVVVDREAHGAGLASGGAEVDGRLAAVGADLEQRADPSALQARVVQGEPLRVGHEALRGARDVEQARIHHGRAGYASARFTAATKVRCSRFVVTRMRSNASPESFTSAYISSPWAWKCRNPRERR